MNLRIGNVGVILFVVLGSLAGCGTTVLKSDQHGVVTDSATPNYSESQHLADVECAKYHRVAKMISGVNAYSRHVTFDCVDNDNQIENSDNKNSGDMYTELKKLKELLDSKIITQEEFDTQKKAILNKHK